MRTIAFDEIVKVRAERGMRAALAIAAQRERTTVAEMLRRELRGVLVRRGIQLPDDDLPEPFPPAPAQAAVAA